MKCAILGVGSIGTLVAGQLSKYENLELLLCSRGEQAMALTALGLQLEIDKSTETVAPNRWTVFDTNEEVPDSWRNQVDVVIICSKTRSTHEMSVIASKLISTEGLVLSLQNGISNENIIAEHCGRQRTLGALTTHGATRLGPGITRWAGVGEVVIGGIVGNIDRDSERISNLIELLGNVGLNPRWSDEIESELWVKLLLNCAVNPIAAICGVSNHALLESSDLHDLSVSVMLEAAQVGRSVGVSLPDDSYLIERLDQVLVATSSNDCSMLQDVRRGSRTEIDSINGEILKVAEQSGIPCPLNSQLVTLVKGIESTLC